MDAFLRLEEHLRLGGKSFGVVAPRTAEGTTLEEDDRTDAGTVVEAELARLLGRTELHREAGDRVGTRPESR